MKPKNQPGLLTQITLLFGPQKECLQTGISFGGAVRNGLLLVWRGCCISSQFKNLRAGAPRWNFQWQGTFPISRGHGNKAFTTCSSEWLLAFFPVKLYKPPVFSSNDNSLFIDFFFQKHGHPSSKIS